jgi:molecular chaperone HscB
MLKVVDSAVPVACWSCSVSHNDSTLFCPHCSKIQPPPGGDYFSVFGLLPKLNLDLDTLENEFHRLSRKVHPDRFARAGDNERQWSLADTALLNDAYRTLKDPLRRTEYLLKLQGAEIGEEFAGKDAKGRADGENGPSRVPADLLEEVFELNMQLEEMRMAQKAGEPSTSETGPQLQADLIEARAKFESLLNEVDSNLRAQWQLWDDGSESRRKEAEKTMIALLDRRRYLRNLVRDVTETLQDRPLGVE